MLENVCWTILRTVYSNTLVVFLSTGIVAASMSTADGAILAMGTVFSHNVMRQLDSKFPNLVTSDNLLMMARISTIPFTLIATLIGSFYRNSDNAAGATGYLLIVAFDIVLASVVAPLFGCFYTKYPSPRAAFCSVLGGVITRVTLEFALPKDGLLLLPFDHPEFYDYGTAASAKLPVFIDAPPEDVWNPAEEPCVQEQFEDYTGVDSLAAFLCSIILFVGVQALEQWGGKPLFNFPGMEGYEKELGEEPKFVDGTERTGVSKADKSSIEFDEKVSGEESDVSEVGGEIDA